MWRRRRRRSRYGADFQAADADWLNRASPGETVCEGCYEAVPTLEGFLADILRAGNTQFLCRECLERGLAMGIVVDYVACGTEG